MSFYRIKLFDPYQSWEMNFFDKPDYEPTSMALLKKKERHQELRDKGYLIKNKVLEDVPDDIPFYEIFDPSNQNYRKIFYSQVAYYYFIQEIIFQIKMQSKSINKNLVQKVFNLSISYPNFEKNEQFQVDYEDIKQAELAIRQQEEANRKIQKILKKKEQEAEIEKRQKLNEAIETVKREKILSKQPISSPSKNQSQKASPHLPFKNYGLAIVGPKCKLSMQKDNKNNKVNLKQQQKQRRMMKIKREKLQRLQKKMMQNTYLKSQCEEFRELIKYNRGSKKLK
ncbi:unnamed protein product [Paramecium sonneborni]|uniref:Uncharacterized protein n=1 Tax=Paramecium sonneborni TaxID=65129 RepID=A0A8S1LBH8_9CILI|nr:unnamed protein product [Paramecium sonneborni]